MTTTPAAPEPAFELTRLVPIDQLTTNGDWVRPLDPEHVHRLVEAESWPPIHVTPAYEVVDGAHRLAAAAHLGRSEVEVIVLQNCTDATAARQWHLTGNSVHGIPLDREHTIRVLTAMYDDGWDRSDRSTVRLLGVPMSHVVEARRRIQQRNEEWSTAPRSQLTTPTKTTGADGRARPASAVDQQAQTEALRAALDPVTNPKPNFSAIAREFGVSRNTVKAHHRALLQGVAEPLTWWTRAWRRWLSWLWRGHP